MNAMEIPPEVCSRCGQTRVCYAMERRTLEAGASGIVIEVTETLHYCRDSCFPGLMKDALSQDRPVADRPDELDDRNRT
jgi:hypothetical protein